MVKNTISWDQLLNKKLLPESQYAEIPSKIRAAYTAKLESNNADNHKFGQISLAIASGETNHHIRHIIQCHLLGAVIRNIATVLGAGAGGLSQAQTLGVIASLLGSGGYSIDRGVKVTQGQSERRL